MADEMDRFYGLLQEQSRTLTAQGLMLATIAQGQKDTHERLFGQNGQPGIIQYLANEDKKLAAEIGIVVQNVGEIKSGHRADKAYVIGGATALSVVVKVVLSKLGWHI